MRAGIVTYLFSALTLVANLVSGIISARALGPDGRGVTVALTTVSQLAGFLFALGVAQSLSYFIARRPEDGPSLLSTWVLLLMPLAAVAIAISELLLPTIFAVDGEQAIQVGRWFLFSIVLVIGLELNYGLLLGAQDFFVYNVLRLAQPTLMAVSFLVLWLLDALTVESALIAPTAGTGLVLAIGHGSLGPADRGRASRPEAGPHARCGSACADRERRWPTHVTARLDVAMLPAFVVPASVGLYSVATNISLIVYQLSSTFAALVLPAAAGDARRGAIKVVGSFWAALAVASVVALGLALFARPLLGFVYGDEFRGAAKSLRLLLPGAVAFAGASILSAGIYAAGRPFTATLTQLLGMVVTIVGLSVFLPTGGVTAAALVSTVSYTSVFIATLVAYKAVSGIPWRGLLPTPRRLRALADRAQ